MEFLKDKQLLLLDCLIYCMDREAPARIGSTVREVADDVDCGLKLRMAERDEKMPDKVAEQMSYADWFEVVDAVRRDSELCALRLGAFGSDERGAKVALFGGNPSLGSVGYVIFAGSGKGEWGDNCVSAFQRDSEQQLRALSWFDADAVGCGYDHIVASGHSKGGNKAQYLAVRRGSIVSRAVSFDGQGFSREFTAAYSDLIEENAPKIVAYALDNDFVNGLMNPIVLPENRHYLRGTNIESVTANHAPFALFAPHDPGSHELELADECAQGDIGKMMVALTIFLQEEPSKDEFRHICSFLGKVMENLVASGRTPQERNRAFAELYASGDFPLTAGYLMRFFQEIGRHVTLSDLVKSAMPKGDAEDADTLADRLKGRLPEKFKGLVGPHAGSDQDGTGAAPAALEAADLTDA